MNKNLRAQLWLLITVVLLALYGAGYFIIDIIGATKAVIKMIQNYYVQQ